MIALAGGAILHDTSKVLHHFPEDRYVAAALELFASVALMFWYVLDSTCRAGTSRPAAARHIRSPRSVAGVAAKFAQMH